MKTTITALSLILLTFLASSAQATELAKLGERLSTCQNLEKDDSMVTYDLSLQREAKTRFENDRLNTAIIAEPDCFRVGTEIQLNLQNDTIPYLGRGLIEKLEVLSKEQLASSTKTGFTKSAVNSFIKNTPAKQYGLIQFKVTEKVEEAVVTEKYKRLNTCFPANGDWEAIRLKDMDSVKNIQDKKTKALIWNGTFNCYKVGVYTEMVLQSENPETGLGFIIPTELHVVHYTNLGQKHADLLGENLSDLKTKMAEKKDLEGGYVTMVVFDYEKTHPNEASLTE